MFHCFFLKTCSRRQARENALNKNVDRYPTFVKFEFKDWLFLDPPGISEA